MGTIRVGALTLEMGKGYRIVDEAELRRRVKLLDDGKSKMLEAIRRFGGKKLKVYGYDLAENRLWMSADKSDTYKWKPFMLADYVESRDKPIIEAQQAGKTAPATKTVDAYAERKAQLASNKENCGEVFTAKDKKYFDSYAAEAAEKSARQKKLLKMMLLMSMFQNANQQAVAPVETGKAKSK